MRSGSATKTILDGNNAWLQADLVTLTPVTGGSIYVTNWKEAIVNDGDTFVSAGGEADKPGLYRGDIRWSVGTEVSVLSLVFVIDAPDQGFSGEALGTLAVNGGLYGAEVLYERVISLTAVGLASAERIWLFRGTVVDVQPSGNQIQLTVKSALAKLGVMLPKRTFASACPYAFCDAACGLSAATYTAARTVTAATDAAHITVSGSISNGYYKRGVIVFTSGALQGLRRTILANTGGNLTLDAPLPDLPAVDDDVDTMRGCAKTLSACTAYSNQTRFPGFPFVARSKK